MAANYGNATANGVVQGTVFANVSTWTPVRVGTANLRGRQWVKIQAQGRDTIRLAILYVGKNTDGTFPTPTAKAYGAFKIPGTALFVEPIGPDITIFVRAVQNGGSSGGIKCVVAEFN